LQLLARNISKSFGATRALDNVSLTLAPGKVHALVGENGAGKSTLFKVLAAHEQIDAGVITLDGKPYNPANIVEAHASGVALVLQEITINPSLGIAENIFIDRMRRFNRAFGLLDAKAMRRAAQQLLDEIGAGVSVSQDLHQLDLGQWKIIEIARALSYDPKVLLLDESTAYLNTHEVDALLKVINSLRAKQIAIGFVSHHLDEVAKVADAITILKDGAWVGDYGVGELTPDEIGGLMVGRALGHDIYPKARGTAEIALCTAEPPILSLQGVSVSGRLDDVSLTLNRGEILGIGGLKGSGGEDILGVINGDLRGFYGQVLLAGRPYQPKSPADAWQVGIGYLPGSRNSEGLILDFTLLENLTLASRPRNGPFRDQRAERKSSHQLMADLHIKAAGPTVPCTSLSGGNLQKVVLGKCLAPNPKILLLNNPTRGIDIGARIEIYRIIHELAQRGMSVILLSEDLMELIGLSDRIAITRVGRVSKLFDHDQAPTEEEIVNYMV
jgi:ribose transport system ATP-binding protein